MESAPYKWTYLLTYLSYTTLDIRTRSKTKEQITNNINQRTKNRHLHITFNNVLTHKCASKNRTKKQVYVKLNKPKMHIMQVN